MKDIVINKNKNLHNIIDIFMVQGVYNLNKLIEKDFTLTVLQDEG